MNSERFDRIVKARANERIQERICKFRETVINAIRVCRPGWQYHTLRYDSELVQIMLAAFPSQKFPIALWSEEEAIVEKELLSIMDEMQKALIAVDKIPDPDAVIPA